MVKRHIERSTRTSFGRLSARVKHPGQAWEDMGVISERLITNAFIALLVSVLQAGSATALQNFKYHASGTGTNPENAANTALQTQVDTRVVGTQTTTGPGNYRSVANVSYSGVGNITEHGLFSAASVGTMMDRSVFAAIPVVNGTLIEFTYDLTISGG